MNEGIPDAGLPAIFSSSPFDLRHKSFSLAAIFWMRKRAIPSDFH
jgi:hypothetical protein